MIRLLILFVLMTAVPSFAAESEAVRSPRATATLLSDTDAVMPGRPFHVALRLRLAPGWHTYWVNPGDAGAAPELGLTFPAGATQGPIAWPAPKRLSENTIVTYAYTGDVILPVEVTPGAVGDAFDVQAKATWLVCERVCVPEEGSFRLHLPRGTPAASVEAALVNRAIARAPVASPVPATVTAAGVLTLRGDALSADTVADATFYPTQDGQVDEGSPQRVRVTAGSISIAFKPGASFRQADLSGVIVLTDALGRDRAWTIKAAPAHEETSAAGLLPALLLAFAAGLLLNLMPCVFPILAMKASALSRLSGPARQTMRFDAAAYVAGVILSFAAFGLVLILARSAGLAVAWGFQFQSPSFVAVVTWLLFAVGLNMSGVFELGTSLTRAGQPIATRRGLMREFLSGCLAVVVASPCTGPFMGGAVAAALSMPMSIGVLVFAALGCGLAAPYALLASSPAVARALPRPGAWMAVLRNALAFPMYAATAWLIWVASEQSGSMGVLVGAAGLVLVGFASWAFGLAQRGAGRGRRVGQSLAAACVLGAGSLLVGTGPVEVGSERFSPERLAQLRAQNQPVFVNMTAAWCITCLVNERVALAPSAVRRAFAEQHVAYLRGDWTRQDPVITAFLRGHDRDGVPLYLFYPPGREPEVLPQILTERVLLDRIGRAADAS